MYVLTYNCLKYSQTKGKALAKIQSENPNIKYPYSNLPLRILKKFTSYKTTTLCMYLCT